MYDNYQYARMRLIDTVVRNKEGVPILVIDVSRGFNVIHENLKTKEIEEAPLKEVDLSPIPLGFMENKNGCFYLGRMPKRQDWRQGFRQQNSNQGRLVDVRSKGFLNCVLGIYPSYEKALEKAKKKESTFPFSRSFAVDWDENLVYKNYGVVGKRKELLENKQWLKEIFEKETA